MADSQKQYDKEVEQRRKEAAKDVETVVECITDAVKTAEEWMDFAYGPRKGEALAVVGMLKSAATKCGQALVRVKSAR